MLFFAKFSAFHCLISAVVAEWSKALRSGRNLFVGAGSNPADSTFCLGCFIQALPLLHLSLVLFLLISYPNTFVRGDFLSPLT